MSVTAPLISPPLWPRPRALGPSPCTRLGGLHPSIPDALAAFGHRVLHHATATWVDIDGCVLHPLGSMGPRMVRAPVVIRAITAPDGDRGPHHILGLVARQTLILRWDCAFFDVGHEAVGRARE